MHYQSVNQLVHWMMPTKQPTQSKSTHRTVLNILYMIKSNCNTSTDILLHIWIYVCFEMTTSRAATIYQASMQKKTMAKF